MNRKDNQSSFCAMLPRLTRVVYVVRPEPKTQACVWQIYAHVKRAVDEHKDKDITVRLIDFKVPRRMYFGVPNYLNQVQLTFRTDSEQQQQQLHGFLETPLPAHERFEFTKLDKKSQEREK